MPEALDGGPRRQARAVEMLNAGTKVVSNGRPGEYLVGSQSGRGHYLVKGIGIEGADEECNCPDYDEHSPDPCKHVLRVHLELSRPPSPGLRPSAGGKSKVRKTYPQNWKAYNDAQVNQDRLVQMFAADLSSLVPDFPRPTIIGGRPLELSLGQQTQCTLLKVYSRDPARTSAGTLEYAVDHRLLDHVPSRMVPTRVLTKPEMTPVLRWLLRVTAMPMAVLEEGGYVAIDSTGIQTTLFSAWNEAKHGEKLQRKWVKGHVLGGTRTHSILQAWVGEENSGDSPQFEPLLRGAIEDGFDPEFVLGDAGYLAFANYRLASELGLKARIPFKSNSVNRAGNRGSPQSWREAIYMFRMRRPEFDADYHQRSNIEALFSALKRRFGESVRSRDPTAQKNEVYCKFIVYNLTVLVHEMFEHGIAPHFLEMERYRFGRRVA